LYDVITVSLLLIAPVILYSETAAYKSRFLYCLEQKQLKSSVSISNLISFPNAYQDLAVDLYISAVSTLGASAHNLCLQYSTETVRATEESRLIWGGVLIGGGALFHTKC